MTKVSNYSDPQNLNFNKAFNTIDSAINNYIQGLSKWLNFQLHRFQNGKKVLNKVKAKFKRLKFNMTQHQTKPVLYDDEVKTYLQSLHTQSNWQSC